MYICDRHSRGDRYTQHTHTRNTTIRSSPFILRVDHSDRWPALIIQTIYFVCCPLVFGSRALYRSNRWRCLQLRRFVMPLTVVPFNSTVVSSCRVLAGLKNIAF